MRTSALYFLRNHACDNNFYEMVTCNNLNTVHRFNKHKYHSYYPVAEIRFKFFAMKYPFQLHNNLDQENKQVIERLLNSNKKEIEMYDSDSDDIDYFNLTLEKMDPINFSNNNKENFIPSRNHRNRLYLSTHNFSPKKYAENSIHEMHGKPNVIIMEKIKPGNFMCELENRIDSMLKKHKVKITSCVNVNSVPRIYNTSDENLIAALLSINPLMFSETSFYGSYSLQSKLNIMYHLYNRN